MAVFSLTVHHGPFLLAVATGDAEVCDLLGSIDLVATVCREQQYKRALLDVISVSPHLSPSEHSRVGAHLGDRLFHLERVGTVVNGEFRVGAGEAAAKAAGLHLRTFDDLRQAFDWMES